MTNTELAALKPVLPEIVKILDIFTQGCVNTRPFNKKAWTCVECYEDVLRRLQEAGVPSRRLAEELVSAHRYPSD